MKKISYDIIIVGGGIIGSTLAVNLAKFDFKILVIESVLPSTIKTNNNPNIRVSSINYNSVQLLRKIDIWKNIDTNFCTPYRKIETWEYSLSTVTFDASLLNLPELGFIIENWRLQKALWNEFTKYNSLTLYCPVSFVTMHYDKYDTCWTVILNNGNKVYCKLLIGADGINSQVRKQANISISGWQYSQSCMLLSIEMTKNIQKDVVWQVLTPSGPLAFLPLYKNWASLAWYNDAFYISELRTLPLSILEKKIQTIFPQKLGTIKLHSMEYFPLIRHHAYEYVKPGLVLVGDAAHTINPLAGLGVNLGFRDVKILAEILISARNEGKSWNKLTILKYYQYYRKNDNLFMQTIIDCFYAIFSNNISSIKFTRNIGLILIQHSDYLKSKVLKYALGL